MRWATQREQSLNTWTNRILTFHGISLTLKEWAVKTGINYGTISNRIHKLGWSIEYALTIPPIPAEESGRKGSLVYWEGRRNGTQGY